MDRRTISTVKAIDVLARPGLDVLHDMPTLYPKATREVRERYRLCQFWFPHVQAMMRKLLSPDSRIGQAA